MHIDIFSQDIHSRYHISLSCVSENVVILKYNLLSDNLEKAGGIVPWRMPFHLSNENEMWKSTAMAISIYILSKNKSWHLHGKLSVNLAEKKIHFQYFKRFLPTFLKKCSWRPINYKYLSSPPSNTVTFTRWHFLPLHITYLTQKCISNIVQGR